MTKTIFIAKNIKHLRKLSGYSQEKLARELNVKRTTISNYESGLSSPDFQSLIRIANIFDISIDALLTKDLTITGQAVGHYELQGNVYNKESNIAKESHAAYQVQRECQLCRQKDKTIEILQESLRQANQMLDNYAKYQQQLLETIENLKKK